MLAPTATATKRAKPWLMATPTNPPGSRAASDVNLAAKDLAQLRFKLTLRKHNVV